MITFFFVHHGSYHSFDIYLIDLVGEDAFMEWMDDTTAELFEQQADIDECYLPEQTIHTFIEYFDIAMICGSEFIPD